MTTTVPAPALRQIRLPGQAPVPDGPIDLTEMLVGHRAFRRDLDLFVAAVPDIPLDDRETWRALNKRWELFRDALHDHHTAEDDGVWPMLRDRAAANGDGAALDVLDAMGRGHAGIDPLLASLGAGFARLAAGADADARTGLTAGTLTAREALGDHLCHEERDALALVQRYLTATGWAQVTRQHVTRPPSMSAAIKMIGWGLHGLPEPIVARVLPRPIRLLWRLFVRDRFTRQEQRLLRYATSRYGPVS